jgi:RNA polymerase sigma factor (sigma-70 family)
MEPMDQAGAVPPPAHPIMLSQLEGFYKAEYPKLVKILRILGATQDEAEDAVQKAMADFAKRLKANQPPISRPAAYVRRAAIRFLVKQCQRDRDRRPREIRGGHLTPSAYLDEGLTAWEDEQYVEQVLASLTPIQREVIKRVMDGACTREIARELGKSDENIRQHLKNSRERLKVHPEVAPRARLRLRVRNRASEGSGSAVASAPWKEGESSE